MKAQVSFTVLVVDDHPVFRFGMHALLNSLPEIAEVLEASTGEEAITLAQHKRPDIILVDINLPDLNGIEVTRRILDITPQANVLIVTMNDDDSVFDALQAGARGYLLKGATPQETIHAIRAVARGEAIFSPSAAERLIDFFEQQPTPATSAPFPDLTEREREVLALMAQGLTNAAIAERLVLSPKTVRNHVSNIFSKLGVSDRTQAVILAREAGLA
ncbi:MAG: DNA-binding response regulator [Ardenticatenia bacterium]|nr:MAG: DNA-binding response regulator [Ardenticatenia bacterium]